MKSLHVSLLGAVLTFTACGLGSQQSTLQDFRDAAPSAQGLSVETPWSGKSKQDLESSQQGLLGAPAFMPGVTLLSTYVVNGGVALTLQVVGSMVATDPWKLTDDSAEWGPFTQPLWRESYRLKATRDQAAYTYVLEGRPKASTNDKDWAVLLTGTHNVTSFKAGHGIFTLDGTALNRLNPFHRLVGQAQVTYARTNKSDVTVKVAFKNAGDVDGPKADSQYAYEQLEGGDGYFQFTAKADYDKKSAALETFGVNSRWHDDGTGRSDVVVQGGDIVSEVRFSECWDKALARTYYGDTVKLFPTEGTEAACAYATASFAP